MRAFQVRAQHRCVGTGGCLVDLGIESNFMSTPVLLYKRRLVSHPAGDVVLSTIPDSRRRVIAFHLNILFLLFLISF